MEALPSDEAERTYALVSERVIEPAARARGFVPSHLLLRDLFVVKCARASAHVRMRERQRA